MEWLLAAARIVAKAMVASVSAIKQTAYANADCTGQSQVIVEAEAGKCTKTTNDAGSDVSIYECSGDEIIQHVYQTSDTSCTGTIVANLTHTVGCQAFGPIGNQWTCGASTVLASSALLAVLAFVASFLKL